MKLVFSVGSDAPNKSKGLVGSVIKLALVAVLGLLAMNRSDIRRYLRLRRM